MKTKVFLFLLLSINLFASGLSPDLKPIQTALVSENDAPSLVGKEYSAKHLIFSDAYLPLDAETKYQIAKWVFSPESTKIYMGKKDVKCRVNFRVLSVNTEDKKMPYIVAEVSSITESK